MKKRKIKKGNLIIAVIILVGIVGLIIFLLTSSNRMIDLSSKTTEEIKQYAEDNTLSLELKYEYSDDIDEGKVVSQNISKGEKLIVDKVLTVIISLGIDYAKYNVNELGNIPIMMYHGIENKTNAETEYTGGNIDAAGYQRTKEAFISDLEFYYENGYRMIRLNDYVNGIIDVPLGKSPIVLTFDDGLSNNIKVTGLDDNGNIIIDSNSAVGILEEFKKKYPDFGVTATFFLNGGLFSQNEYNSKIIIWLLDNGYDIGNHTYSHLDFTSLSETSSVKEVGRMYQLLDEYAKDKYVKIIALPFGSPYSETHENFKHILKGNYEGYEYETISTLRVGWESDVSPFSTNFNSKFLKRIRAYDNNGTEFDIEMNFKALDNTRYISDGNKDQITIPKDKTIGNEYNLKVVKY